jgi:hypothetical protein
MEIQTPGCFRDMNVNGYEIKPDLDLTTRSQYGTLLNVRSRVVNWTNVVKPNGEFN